MTPLRAIAALSLAAGSIGLGLALLEHGARWGTLLLGCGLLAGAWLLARLSGPTGANR